MVASELHRRSELVAFPIDKLFSDRGDFVGFTMRKARGVKPIHELYAPGSRKAEFPTADYRFLARTATNVARAVASVHLVGCIIGDINHSGILVKDQATVTLIDADSFQVRLGTMVYRCRVGVKEYTPPELQGQPLGEIDRQPWHDAFGLAIVVFQLLFMGRHPFAGRFTGQGDVPIDRAIKEGRFAFSIERRTETRMDPPPLVPTLSDMTPDVASAFERAFQRSPSRYQSRPTPADWVKLLTRFEQELIPCRLNPAHHHPKNAKSCPWCRLESGMGNSLFPRSAFATTSLRSSNFDLASAMADIDRVLSPGQAPDPVQAIPLQGPLRSASAAKVRWERAMRRLGGVLIAIVAVVGLASGIEIALVLFFLAGYLMFGGNEAHLQLRAARDRAESEWKQLGGEWELETGPSRFEAKRTHLMELVKEYRGLPARESALLQDLERRRRDIQLQRFLEGHRIGRARIEGIGDGRKATLASFGIETAFDVTVRTVRGVPGFGEVLTSNLAAWRRTIERRFSFNPSLGTDPVAIQQVRDKIARRRDELEVALRRGPTELEQLRVHAIASRRNPTQRMIEARRALAQAQVDLA